MKYDRSWVMKQAWAIRRSEGCSMSDALKKSWIIEKLEVGGGKRWTKAGRDRMYLGKAYDLVGLEVARYNSGNVKWATLDGNDISNRQASGILWAMDRAYVDLQTMELIGRSDLPDGVVAKIERITGQAAA